MNSLSDEETKRILRQGADEARKEAASTIEEIKELLKLFR